MNVLELNPQWSRIIHRLHGLGAVETSYLNQLAQYSELGEYPRYIASASETHSESTDGSTHWNFSNWDSGIVRNVGTTENAIIEFLFRSPSSFCFHKLKLDQLLHHDCLNCLLQLFAKKSHHLTDRPKVRHPQMLQRASSLERLTELLVSRHAQYHGFHLELFTEGGRIKKQLHPKQVQLQRDRVQIHCHQDRSLELLPEPQSQIQSQRSGSFIHTTLLNASNMPQVTLKIPA